MILKKIIPLIAAVSILGLSACGGQVTVTPSEGSIQTAIAQTMEVQTKLQNAVSGTLTALGKGAMPPGQPSATETPASGETSASGKVTLSVSTNTWCTTGPGSVYGKVFILYVGDTAEVVGRDENGLYWVIKNPKNPAVTCWLWGKYATVTGDASKLPVITPPPTPTAPPAVVTAATIAVGNSIIHSGNCHFNQSFTITITTIGPATVNYTVKQILQGVGEWSIDGFPAMTFNAAGTQGHQGSVSGTQCGTWVYKVIVSSPNSITGQASFKVISP